MARIQKNPKYQKRLKRAEDVRFNLRQEEALAAIMAAGEKSWMAHAWLLERTCPNLYALRAVHRDQALTEKPIGSEIPAERPAEYGKLMLEFAKEAEARAAQTTRTEPLPEVASL
jgi:hypothetical protein